MTELEVVSSYIDPGGEFCIRFCKNMPGRIKGTIAEDEAGFYNIYVNAELAEDAQESALRHEVRHMIRNDFKEEAK